MVVPAIGQVANGRRPAHHRVMPSMNERTARARLAGERAVRMATVGEDGLPHIVVHTFAMLGDRIVHAVDHKPKSTPALRRLANIAVNPGVSVLADNYTEDWQQLWWVRADGRARVIEHGPERAALVGLLVEKYSQYRHRPPEGSVVAVDVTRWTGWSYANLGDG
jgi:PPOX class probable F420-dependent enzyme